MAEYLMAVKPADQTRLAFQFMSLADNDCNGQLYSTPRIAMTPLPVAANHALIKTISDERFQGGFGTHIEGALRGLSSFTTAHARDVAKPAGRATIGILMTDGEPNGCEGNIDRLAKIVEDHVTATNGEIKMFFIGETGALLSSLEKYAVKGGAAAHSDYCGSGPKPCHYWDVGDGQPEALASALSSIVGQATVENPIPCTFKVPEPPAGLTFDAAKVNVKFTEKNGTPVSLFRVANAAACNAEDGGWHYDNADAPTQVLLCQKSCTDVSESAGAQIKVEFGCESRTGPIR
jgi:histone H3/H4